MIFQAIQTDGIAQISYLIGDDSAGVAAVIDPRPNVDVYLKLARRHRVAITHIFETHIHADFVSGARELASRVGGAKIMVSEEGDATYDFECHKIADGNQFTFGSFTVTARHTPGHTPEHLAYEIAQQDSPKDPWGVFTGDSLFVGSAGRPDLLGEEHTDELTKSLYRTLRDYYRSLDDGVMIYPCHGAGSACGADIGDRPMSTIGRERNRNPFLQFDNFEDFEEFVQAGAPPVPQHYPILKKVNARGPELLGHEPVIPGLPPKDFQAAMEDQPIQLVDTRQMLGFGGGHISGAINIGDRPELSVWAGDILDYDVPILLVVEDEAQLAWLAWHFAYVGLTNFVGYLAGGMKAWANAGMPIETLPQLTVHQLRQRQGEFQILDVRSSQEYNASHLKQAKHKYVAELRNGVKDNVPVEVDEPIAVYCGSGYRASLAASLLKRGGFAKVHNVPGSMLAWRKAGFTTTSD